MLTSTNTDNIGLREYPASTVAGLEVNTLWDGLFHATTWVFVAVGLALLWRAWQERQAPRAGRSLVGLLLAGWGLFNLVGASLTTTCSASTTFSPATMRCCSTWASLAWGRAAGRRLGAVPLRADRAGPGHLGPAGDTPIVVAG